MVSDSYRNRIGLEGRRGWRRWRRSWRSSSLDPSGGDGGDNSTLLGGSGGGGDPSGREEAQGDRGRTHKRRDLPRSSSGFAEMRGIEADIVEGMWGIERVLRGSNLVAWRLMLIVAMVLDPAGKKMGCTSSLHLEQSKALVSPVRSASIGDHIDSTRKIQKSIKSLYLHNLEVVTELSHCQLEEYIVFSLFASTYRLREAAANSPERRLSQCYYEN